MIFSVHFSFILKISCLWCMPVSSLPILSSCQASFLLTAFMFHIDECSWSHSQKLQNRCVLFCISQVLKLKSTMARFPSFTFYYRKRTLFSWKAWNYDYKDALTWRIQGKLLAAFIFSFIWKNEFRKHAIFPCAAKYKSQLFSRSLVKIVFLLSLLLPWKDHEMNICK